MANLLTLLKVSVLKRIINTMMLPKITDASSITMNTSSGEKCIMVVCGCFRWGCVGVSDRGVWVFQVGVCWCFRWWWVGVSDGGVLVFQVGVCGCGGVLRVWGCVGGGSASGVDMVCRV